MIEIFKKIDFATLSIFIMGIAGFFIGWQARKDKHAIDTSTRFNIDLDNLNDSFDISQKLLKSLREQLDNTQSLLNETQEMLDNANSAYTILEGRFKNVVNLNVEYKKKIASLDKENKELIARIKTCDFECEFKKNKDEKNK
jgi:chromosome segregation ATPase